ncbi:sensor histidine kinase [Pedobacter namyangjuensis]|uniref:sensor histidine kinase n=1 Tax=Pedobacter namyangjuensis TaxID=600626 RepID=UPI000DE22323|nr:histidine kinase [Pedobacter namyangjuensis]
MRNFVSILILLVVFCLYACKENSKTLTEDARKTNLKILKKISEEQRKNDDLQGKLKFWYKQLKDPRFAKDSVLESKIHYNIAGVFYNLNEIDSIKSHMHIAWELMEKQPAFDEEKILLYSGLGNIASLEQKIHQENYYFNRAAQMLLADSSLDILPKSKTTIFFAAAQSSAKLKQFQAAFKYNRSAMALFPQLKDDIDVKFRGYSQMAVCFFSSNGNLDSLNSYIQKMESMNKLSPSPYKTRFIADRKAVYFDRREQLDSTLHYNKIRVAMDLADIKENGDFANSIHTGNMFLSFSDIAAFYINTKKLDSGLYYLSQCEEFAKKYPNKIDDEAVMLYRQNTINYLFATKQYQRAEKQQEILLSDFRRFYETENARSIAEMSTLINLQAKDKSINNLNATVALSQEILQSNRLWLLVSVLGTILAIVLAILIYYIQKQRRIQNENEKSQLAQRLLRTQMEPHFIFNTLSALQSFVRFDEKEKTLKYLNQFGRLLRSSLVLSRESLVPLNEEVEALENYLSLQQMRFDNAFDYEINLHDEQDLETIYIPPMLIQPFVENALLHGINPNGKNGHIYIDFNFNDKFLVVSVNDNGKGISVHQDTAKHKSLSTTISKERLAIMAKETGLPAGINIKSQPNKGTEVLLTIPIQYCVNVGKKANA